MSKLLPSTLVIALLAATAGAFAFAERLKLEPTPITGTRVDKQFSPTCECDESTAVIQFRLRRRDLLTVSIVGEGGTVVRNLDVRRSFGPGRHEFVWDGHDDNNALLPDGLYYPRVHLARFGRTFDLPNAIRLDTTPPRITVGRVFPRVLTPDGNFVHDRLVVDYRVSEPAKVLLFVNGKRRYRSRFQRLSDKAEWYGRVGGHDVRAGAYRLVLVARDRAGNVSDARAAGVVHVRYVRLASKTIRARAGSRFRVRVLTDGPHVRWHLHGRTGVGRPSLVLRAPRKPGRYRLYVAVGRHGAQARLIVRGG